MIFHATLTLANEILINLIGKFLYLLTNRVIRIRMRIKIRNNVIEYICNLINEKKKIYK